VANIVRGRTSKHKGILPNGVVAQPKKVVKMDLEWNELEIYPSIGAAARSVGSTTSTVQEILYGRGRFQTKGFRFKFA
jgi:hypothetical protein